MSVSTWKRNQPIPAASTSGNANQSHICPPVGQVLTVTMTVVDPGEALRYFESALTDGLLVSGCKVIAVGVKNPFEEIERLRKKISLAIDALVWESVEAGSPQASHFSVGILEKIGLDFTIDEVWWSDFISELPNGELYFRYDTGDKTTNENGDLCVGIQAKLLASGYILEPCIEHDCISGIVHLVHDGES